MLQSFGYEKAKHFPIIDYFEQKCTSNSVHPTTAPDFFTRRKVLNLCYVKIHG